ncbi:MAG: DUF5666 domain-containing protein [Candidatus Polarisedimenticolaceae bacterium]|nr:DUF5666 domain-containing protein [Candidatus Polarisedimenticolaceae bacterium]
MRRRATILEKSVSRTHMTQAIESISYALHIRLTDLSGIMPLLLLAALLSTMAMVGCSSQTRGSWPEHHAALAYHAGGEEEGDGVGGTGLQPEEDGIGGTGILVEGDSLGGTGIIGPISGFGSIIVNGLHISYPPDVEIGLNGQPASIQALKIGRMVEVHALPATDGLAARHIEVLDAVIGPVEAVSRQNGSLRLLGQTVYLDSETVLPSGLDVQHTLNNIRPGQLLRVSGLHLADGSLVATRMEPAAPGTTWLVTGLVRNLATDSFSIGGLQIKRDTAWPDRLRNGRLAMVQGAQVDGHFLGKTLRLKPDTPFNGRVERLVIQGYPRPATDAGTLRIGNLQMDMPVDSAAKEIDPRMPLTHQRIQLTAQIGRNGEIHAEQMVTIQSAPAAAIGRLPPPVKPPSTPKPRLKWNRTPDQIVPKPPLSDRSIQTPRPPIRQLLPLNPPSKPKQLPNLTPLSPPRLPAPVAHPTTPKPKRAVTR